MSKPTALITGANRGIGLALVHALLGSHDIIAVSRTENPDLHALPLTYLPTIDVCQNKDTNRLKTLIKDRSIDLLCHVAGVLSRETIHTYTPETEPMILEQFKVNAMAPITMTAQFLDQIPKGGKIVMLTSRMGSIEDNTSGGRLGYRMSKAALNIASKSLSIDLKEQGIAVGIIHPGWVQTRMVNYTGHITAEACAAMVVDRINELNLENSGTFFHANGEILPW